MNNRSKERTRKEERFDRTVYQIIVIAIIVLIIKTLLPVIFIAAIVVATIVLWEWISKKLFMWRMLND